MALRTVARCGTVAFSPSAPLMAVGTMAGAVDGSFSTSACLEVCCARLLRLAGDGAEALAQIFRLDLASSSPKRDLALAGGAVTTTERFHRLAWSSSGVETAELPVRTRRRRHRHRPAGVAPKRWADCGPAPGRPTAGAPGRRPGGRHREPLEPGQGGGLAGEWRRRRHWRRAAGQPSEAHGAGAL